MPSSICEQVGRLAGRPVHSLTPLGGGCVADVYLAEMGGGGRLVVKIDRGAEPRLDLEGDMLTYLARECALPVPAVIHASARLLVMEHLTGGHSLNDDAQRHAAELLASLHAITAERYGFERDTLIGGLIQSNPPHDSWLSFFAEQRLGAMAREAKRAGQLPDDLLLRVERFGDGLDRWLAEPDRPSLIHGDAWAGNILALPGRITGFVDPAIYFADAEIELAFTTLFGTFGRPFFERYEDLRPLRPGFHEVRRDIYNLYPLLVHARLFGGSYVAAVDQTLRRFGG
jgi:fructosamine-3-kinase